MRIHACKLCCAVFITGVFILNNFVAFSQASTVFSLTSKLEILVILATVQLYVTFACITA